MIKKECRFQKELNKAIQQYADLFCEGNFNLAVRQLCKKGLNDDARIKNLVDLNNGLTLEIEIERSFNKALQADNDKLRR